MGAERIGEHVVTALALAALASSACMGNDFRPASLVSRPRIVGMVTAIDGDVGRAAPVALDHFTASPILVVPEGEEGTLSTFWLACLAAPTRSGVPSCGSMPLGISGLPAAGVVSPIDLDVPAFDASPLGAPSLLLTLVSCDGGAVPMLDASTFGPGSTTLPTCEGGAADARAEVTVFTMPLAADVTLANRHPSIADEAFTFATGDAAAAPWDETAVPVPTGACASEPETAALPHVIVSSTVRPVVTLGWSSRGDDRETYSVLVTGTGETTTRRESLQVSHFVTAGTLERQFSGVESTDPDDVTSDVEWTPPVVTDVPDGGVVVRFWWVERDLRGGMDVAARTLCVVPER